MVVTISKQGYVKSQPVSSYQAQKRGGKGKIATAVKDEDYITNLLVASTHDTILCFSSIGKVYWLKVHQLPVANRTAKGRPIVNLLPLAENEKITAILPIREYAEDKSIFMATANGTVKQVALTDFSRQRQNGIIAIDLVEGDTLIGVEITDGKGQVLITSTAGKAIRFACDDVRTMGRTAKGVRGIKLGKGHKVISLIVLQEGGNILTATENGYGKRTSIDEFSTIGRGGQGVISIQTSERNGKVIGALQVQDNDELLLISDQGTLVRTRVSEISIVGRNTQGVRLINIADNEKLVGIQRVDEVEATDTTDVIEDIIGE
jgi:DNA gyrase subunit A